MHIWRFFRIPDDYDYIPDYVDIRHKLPLYAVTTKKKLAKEFIKGRKKDRFIVKKMEVDEDEANEYLKENRGQILKYFDLSTKNNNEIIEVKVLMTEFENDNLTMMEESFGFLGSITMITPEVFSEKAWYIIEQLDYSSAYCICNDERVCLNGDSYPYLDWRCDQLGLYLYINDSDIDAEKFISTIKV